MQWNGFGTKAVATGKGVGRSAIVRSRESVTVDYGAQVTFSDVEWCPNGYNSALSYNQSTLAIYGKPIEFHPHPAARGESPYTVTEAEAVRLRARVGRRGLKRKVYRHVGPLNPDCQPFTG
jgi:hypothetical protein